MSTGAHPQATSVERFTLELQVGSSPPRGAVRSRDGRRREFVGLLGLLDLVQQLNGGSGARAELGR